MRKSVLSGAMCIVAAGYFFACGGSGDSGNGGKGGGGTSSGGSSASGGTSGSGGSGATTGGTSGTTGGGGGGTGGAAGGGGGASGSGGSGGSGADAGLKDVSFTYDGPVDNDGGVDACAATTVKAEPAPLDMYLMQDNSGSMGIDCSIGQSGTSKWCYAVNALDQFFKAAPAGTGIALQYFPKCWNPATAAQCSSGASCAVPEVALGQLPGALNALEASLNNNAPGGTTPTEAALRGLATYTTANKQPGRIMIGILITDGIPEACDLNANNLAAIVQNHLTNDGIKTFVVGMTGATYSTLDTIAAPGGAKPHTQYCGGGSSPCYHYDVGNGNPAAFNAVLQAIQQSAVGCQFTMPTSDAGIIDPSKVNVEYSPGGNPPAQSLKHVTDQTQCAGGGWYYDNNASPKSINLCASTCSVVQVDSGAKIDVALGCLGS